VPTYSDHALRKMAQRRITKLDVESALRRPTGAPTPGQPGTMWIRGYAAGGRILKVCVRATDPDYVITAAWPGMEEVR
jgi:hypothetical protein